MSTAVAVGGGVLGGSATVGFTPAASTQVDADIVIEVDWDNDGDFSETVEDITAFVMAVESTAGRDHAASLSGVASPGQLRITVLNSDDRFSYFNGSSALTTDPFSLKMGKKVRVRTDTSTGADPVLLARDRFNRADGPLGTAETGQAWTAHAGEFFIENKIAQLQGNEGAYSYETIDVGEADVYVQATIAQLTDNREAGVVARYTDTNNFVTVYYDTTSDLIYLHQLVAGVGTTLGTYALAGWEGMTIGLGLVGTAATAYVGGAPVITGTVTSTSATRVGLTGFHDNYQSARGPEMADFHCWDSVAGPLDGVLWTGDLKSVSDQVTYDGVKTAVIDCEGVLARAARTLVASPRLALGGAKTGLVIGDVLSRANLLHPPAPLAEGAVTTGPVGIPDDKALTLARQFEAIEQGLIFESNEGQVDFQDSTSRDDAVPQAWFSDTSGVGQYQFDSITPVDHRGRIINRVVANVAPDTPGPITAYIDFGSGHVDVDMPDFDDDDLVIVTIASTMNGAHSWLKPLWWQEHRDFKTALGMRIYSHFGGGGFSGATVRFYTHNGAEAGLWMSQTFVIKNWFGSYEGVLIGDVARSEDATAVAHSWGRAPTLFLAAQTGITGTGAGMAYDPNTTLPVGYERPDGDSGSIVGSGAVTTDAGVAAAYKIDAADAEDPTTFQALVRASIQETVLIAVRGYNGPHTKATLANPRTVGGDGRSVIIEDIDSQDEHQAISTWESPTLYASETEAEIAAQGIIDRYADDRPVISISFPATKDAGHRQQAIDRRVGDMIYLTGSGATGLGIDGRFFIESTNHRWSDGGKRWDCTWDLSPA